LVSGPFFRKKKKYFFFGAPQGELKGFFRGTNSPFLKPFPGFKKTMVEKNPKKGRELGVGAGGKNFPRGQKKKPFKWNSKNQG